LHTSHGSDSESLEALAPYAGNATVKRRCKYSLLAGDYSPSCSSAYLHTTQLRAHA